MRSRGFPPEESCDPQLHRVSTEPDTFSGPKTQEARFQGFCGMGGTGLEPVTPSLSRWGSRSRQCAHVRSNSIVEPKSPLDRTLQRTRTNSDPCHPCHARRRRRARHRSNQNIGGPPRYRHRRHATFEAGPTRLWRKHTGALHGHLPRSCNPDPWLRLLKLVAPPATGDSRRPSTWRHG
jgi:hypothetical protein